MSLTRLHWEVRADLKHPEMELVKQNLWLRTNTRVLLETMKILMYRQGSSRSLALVPLQMSVLYPAAAQGLSSMLKAKALQQHLLTDFLFPWLWHSHVPVLHQQASSRHWALGSLWEQPGPASPCRAQGWCWSPPPSPQLLSPVGTSAPVLSACLCWQTGKMLLWYQNLNMNKIQTLFNSRMTQVQIV